MFHTIQRQNVLHLMDKYPNSLRPNVMHSQNKCPTPFKTNILHFEDNDLKSNCNSPQAIEPRIYVYLMQKYTFKKILTYFYWLNVRPQAKRV